MPRSVRLAEAPSYGQPITEYSPAHEVPWHIRRSPQSFSGAAASTPASAARGSERSIRGRQRRRPGRGGELTHDRRDQEEQRTGAWTGGPDSDRAFGRIECAGGAGRRRSRPNPEQPRRTFDPDELQQLADSIAAHGVLQPIVVVEEAEGYRPHRRGAASACGAASSDSKPSRRSFARLTNRSVSRSRWSRTSSARTSTRWMRRRAYRHLIDEFGLTQEHVARTRRAFPASGRQYVAYP